MVSQVLILNFSIFCVYKQTVKLPSRHVSRKLRLETSIFLATLLFEMSSQKTKVLLFRSLLFIESQKLKINIEFIEMNAFGSLFPGNLIQHTA